MDYKDEKESVQSIGGVDETRGRSRFKTIYYNPHTQIVMLGFVCFLCPGLFNALNGLGAGGQVSSTTSANANAALYAAFAFTAFFAGPINNRLGSRLTLFLGTIGYALYTGSYLALNIHSNAGTFVIVAGAILGVCAGLLWTAQGSLMLAYPTENQKGRFIAIFWSIFNLGGVFGAAVSLAQNFHSSANSVSNGTYIGFLVLSLIGVVIPLLMANPDKMVRSDGKRAMMPKFPSWKTGFIGLWTTLHDDPAIVLLFPMFFASNWYYTWQFNDYNAVLFTIRARSLNNLVYWLTEIIGAMAIAVLLDHKGLTRRKRAFVAWTILLAVVFTLHIWAYFYQRSYTRDSVKGPAFVRIDIHDPRYIGRIWLYVFCGLLDVSWQTILYWMLGAISNDSAKLAYITGFYKSIQSAGAAGVWRADAVGLPFMNIFLSTWLLLVVGLVCALPMVHYRVRNYTDT